MLVRLKNPYQNEPWGKELRGKMKGLGKEGGV